METLSFVLGIAFVVVIGIAVVATYAFFKVLKTKNELEDLRRQLGEEINSTLRSVGYGTDAIHRRIDEAEKQMASQVQHVYKRIDDLEKEVFSQLDSRLDKLETKLTKSSTKN